MMPMDCSLNKDLHKAVKKHRLYTNTLDDDDLKKFSTTTPKRGVSAYCRIWDPSLGPDGGCPRGGRINEDITQIVKETIMKIVQVRGIVIPGVDIRRG